MSFDLVLGVGRSLALLSQSREFFVPLYYVLSIQVRFRHLVSRRTARTLSCQGRVAAFSAWMKGFHQVALQVHRALLRQRGLSLLPRLVIG